MYTTLTNRNHKLPLAVLVHRASKAIVLTLALATSSTASAEIVLADNFDRSALGSAPDNGVSLDDWEFPTFTNHPDIREASPDQLSIVETSILEPTMAGNALRIETNISQPEVHLQQRFEERIRQSPDKIVRASFDVFVEDTDPNKQGGLFVYLGGDHSGHGAAKDRDRGPQLYWDAQGRLSSIYCASSDCGSGQLRGQLKSTPVDTWQHVQLDIDLTSDRFDLFWAAADAPLELISTRNGFRSGTQDFLDRITVALFTDAPSRPEGVAYLDNINIQVLPKLPGDVDLDGIVDFADFLALADNFGGRRAAWSQGDFDGDRRVEFSDFLVLSDNFGAVAANSVAAVPEPNGAWLSMFGVLALLGIRKRR